MISAGGGDSCQGPCGSHLPGKIGIVEDIGRDDAFAGLQLNFLADLGIVPLKHAWRVEKSWNLCGKSWECRGVKLPIEKQTLTHYPRLSNIRHMRFIALLMLCALAFSGAAHAHCLVEDCSAAEQHADDPLCLDGQACAGAEALRTADSVTLAEPVVGDREAVPMEASRNSRLSGLSPAPREAPTLEQLQTFLI